MKSIAIAVTLFGVGLVANGQGTFDPATSNSDSSYGAHTGGTVYQFNDFITQTSIRCYGSGYQGQYYIGPAGTTDPNALVPVGPAAGFQGSSPTSLSAGYYNGDGSGTVLTSFAPGTQVVLQLRAWQGAAGSTYASAVFRGGSSLVTIALGGAGSPPSLPTPITSLQSFVIPGPEPRSIALCLIGAGALLMRRQKSA